MLKNGWMSGVFVNETSAGFTEWMEKGYKDFPVVVDPASVPKGLEPDFSANSVISFLASFVRNGS